jgi:hypothetical protein
VLWALKIRVDPDATRYLQERERQQGVQEQDVKNAVCERTIWAGGNQQGGQ